MCFYVFYRFIVFVHCNQVSGDSVPKLIIKNKKKFPHILYKEIHMGSVAKHYMRKGFLTYEEMPKYFTIYKEAVCNVWLCTDPFSEFPYI